MAESKIKLLDVIALTKRLGFESRLVISENNSINKHIDKIEGLMTFSVTISKDCN